MRHPRMAAAKPPGPCHPTLAPLALHPRRAAAAGALALTPRYI
ncbi:hypothetical protein ACT3OH_15385 [Vreelandella zhanjiangensis]